MMIDPWKVPSGLKVTADAYMALLKEHLQRWYERQTIAFKRTRIFMHDNAASRSEKKTAAYLKQMSLCEPGKMTWPACSPDLDHIPREPVEHRKVAGNIYAAVHAAIHAIRCNRRCNILHTLQYTLQCTLYAAIHAVIHAIRCNTRYSLQCTP